MSESVIVSKALNAVNVQEMIELGQRLAQCGRAVNTVDGPYEKDGKQCFVVYTKDLDGVDR